MFCNIVVISTKLQIHVLQSSCNYNQITNVCFTILLHFQPKCKSMCCNLVVITASLQIYVVGSLLKIYVANICCKYMLWGVAFNVVCVGCSLALDNLNPQCAACIIICTSRGKGMPFAHPEGRACHLHLQREGLQREGFQREEENVVK